MILRPSFFLAAIVFALAPSLVSGQILLDEQFNGTAVDTNLFTFSGAGDESFFGRTQLNSPDLPGAFNAPEVSGGTLRLRLQTFNPFGSAAGDLFLGEEIRTQQIFAPTDSAGISFSVRSRFVNDATNPLQGGLVGGMFTFGLDPNSNPLVRDEVDIELLSNLPDEVLANVFDDQGFNSGGVGLLAPVPGLDITEFNDYRIELTTTAIRFFVNDELFHEDLDNLAIDPQDFRLNINAPDSSFGAAFNSALQPTANPDENETFIFEVDSLVIRQISAVPEPASGVLIGLLSLGLLVRRRVAIQA